MPKFKDIQNLNLEAIESVGLRNAIQNLLSEYEAEDNKELFIKTAKGSIEKLYQLVEVSSPDAIHGNHEHDEEGETDKEKKKKRSTKSDDEDTKAKSKIALADLEEINSEIEGCRQVMREYNKKRKEANPPKKKTRLVKLKDKLLSIVPLIPEKLKEDEKVLNKTQKILLKTLNDLKKTWGMTVVKKAEAAIKEKFDQLEQKAG